MTLLAAFQVLLYRYSGQEDIAVGTPIAGRGRSELEGLIGFFANTLVLRSDLSGNPGFRELLARVRESALGAYTHQDLPFEKLVEELAPARDLSRNPLFQVMFVLQNAPSATLALEGVEVSRLALEGHTAKFDLSLGVRETPAGLRVSWEFSTDLFDAPTIERMAGHFTTLLEAIVADPGQRIGELPLLSAAERHQLLVEWNDTAADYPRNRCIHELFEAQAARTPEAVAVVFEDRQLTYAELNARANQLAHHLIGLGVGPEVLVGICMERSLELIVGLLAILKAGGAYVPLDPGYPASAPGVHAQGHRSPGAAHAAGAARAAAAVRRAHPVPGSGLAGHQCPQRSQSTEQRHRPSACLRHLYLRIHRQTQGGGRAPPWCAAFVVGYRLRTARRTADIPDALAYLIRRINLRAVGSIAARGTLRNIP